MRAMAIMPPGMFLSQPPITTTPSIAWPLTEVSIASAITSRDTSEYFIASVPMPMPSVTVGKPNACGIAPASRSAFIARSTSGWMPALHGFMFEWPFATPTIGLSKSASPNPTARSMARLGERATPWVIRRERGLFGMAASGEPKRAPILARTGVSSPVPPPRSRGARAMLIHPNIDPVAISIGPLAVRWYGLMYLVGFGLFFFLARYRARNDPWRGASYQLIDDLLFYGVLGVVLGGRLGYVLFYKAPYYSAHPLEIFAVWQGGMSFHGGFLGVLVAMAWLAHKQNLRWLQITDFIAPLVPPGLAFGRLGNFINGELWGRPTGVPWGMVFPNVDGLPPHPPQLYEFALEGVLLFTLLWLYARKPRPAGAVSGLFLIGYGSFRFLVEFTREPDDFLGLLSLGMSMGQWLSLPMVIAGVLMMVLSTRRPA